MSDWPALLSTKQAAGYLSLSVAKVRELRSRGFLKSVRVDGAIRYRRRELDQFIESLPEGEGEFPAAAWVEGTR